MVGYEALPREYRMKRSRMRAFLWAIALGMLGLLAVVLPPDDLSASVKAGILIAAAALMGWLFHATLRCSTVADLKAIHVRGMARRRRLAWEDIQDIRAEANPAAAMQSDAAGVLVHAYGRDGSKVLLPFLDDQHVNVERELGILLGAWEELRGADWAPSPAAAVAIDRRNARQQAVWAGLAAVMVGFIPLTVLALLPLFVDLPGWLESLLNPFTVLVLGSLLLFALTAITSYRKRLRND
ncbi:PH domain-containing protein [Streptomyces sp. NPDC051016]|uniref:PH domain-containing protein n=1 Tax=Streptomyces sp. NPDC051016 TaxID=3365638 RepID=UPI00378916A4